MTKSLPCANNSPQDSFEYETIIEATLGLLRELADEEFGDLKPLTQSL